MLQTNAGNPNVRDRREPRQNMCGESQGQMTYPSVSGDRCGDAVGFSLSKRRRGKGRRQAEKAGLTPRIARTILRSADGDRPRRRRLDGMDTGSMLAAPLDTSIRGTGFMEYRISPL